MSIPRRLTWPILLVVAAVGLPVLQCRRAVPPEPPVGIHRLFAAQDWRHEGGKRQSRLAFSARLPSHHSERVTIPHNAILRWHHAASDRTSGRTVEISVSLRDEDATELLYKEVVQPSPGNPGTAGSPRQWHAAEVDLSAWGGRRVEISFEARSSEDAAPRRAKVRPARVFWSSPFIVATGVDRATRPSVVLILVDTLRADRLGVLGYERELTPHLDALAARGTLFENAFSQSNWTLTSAASLFTGLYPTTHGVSDRRRRLKSSPESIARLFAANGHVTAGFHEGGYLSPNFGFADGFDHYAHWNLEDPSAVSAWLGEHRSLPFLLFLHTYAVHAPFNSVPEEYWGLFADPKRLAEIDPEPQRDVSGSVTGLGPKPATPAAIGFMADLYDGEVRFVDDQIAKLDEELERLGLRDRTLIVVTSDHGEEFGEHGGLYHGTQNLHPEVTRIPLILAGPGIPIGGRITDPVQLADLLPTLADLVGLDGIDPAVLDGRSFSMLLQMDQVVPDAARPARLAWSEKGDARAIRSHNWTLIVNRDQTPRLYDRRIDPLELHDVSSRNPRVVEQLSDAMRRVLARSREDVRTEAGEVDAETLDELRALGYVD